MPNTPVLLICCVLGALLGHLVLKKDRLATGLGIATGVGPAFAVGTSNPLFLLAVPVFGACLIWRKKSAK